MAPGGFETGFENWSNVGGDDIDWTRDSGGTPSSGTGPTVDHTTGTSSGFYLYTESSTSGTGYPNMTANLESACIGLGGMSDASWSFWYHMLGSAMGALNAEVAPGCGSTWETVFSVSGDQGNAWLQANIDLSAYVGTSVRLRFRGVTGTNYTSDMAIDDVSLTATPVLVCTLDSECNDGLFCNGVETCGGTGVCQPGVAPCAGQTCNEASDQCVVLGPDAFEGGFGNWPNVGGDVFDWTRDSGGTPSSSTGPSIDHTTGTSSGYYLFTESSSPRTQGDDAILEGPCIDLTAATRANLDLWYHMYGSGMGTLEVQVASSTGGSCASLGGFAGVFGVSGNQGDQWHEANVDLAPYTGGSVRIRIIGVRGSSYTSDLAIDDVSVEAAPE